MQNKQTKRLLNLVGYPNGSTYNSCSVASLPSDLGIFPSNLLFSKCLHYYNKKDYFLFSFKKIKRKRKKKEKKDKQTYQDVANESKEVEK